MISVASFTYAISPVPYQLTTVVNPRRLNPNSLNTLTHVCKAQALMLRILIGIQQRLPVPKIEIMSRDENKMFVEYGRSLGMIFL